MAYDIPTAEPTALEAGTSLIFTRDLPDYDPGEWTLTYHLISPTEAPITFSATEVDDQFKVDVAASTTQGWPSGNYLMSGYVSEIAGSQRHLIYRKELQITPAISGAESFEWRSYARQMLDLIEEQLRTGLVRDTISYSINGRSFTCKSNQDLLQARDYFRAEVGSEDQGGRQKKILARFLNAR